MYRYMSGSQTPCIECFSLDLIYLVSLDRISGGYQEDILEQFEKSKMAAIVNRKLNYLLLHFYLPRRRRPGTGDIAMPPVRLSVCLNVMDGQTDRWTVCLSVHPSRLVFAL